MSTERNKAIVHRLFDEVWNTHRSDDRIAFGDLAAPIVGAMEVQHRLLDAVDLMDG
jgi:hypothetical protein